MVLGSWVYILKWPREGWEWLPCSPDSPARRDTP